MIAKKNYDCKYWKLCKYHRWTKYHSTRNYKVKKSRVKTCQNSTQFLQALWELGIACYITEHVNEEQLHKHRDYLLWTLTEQLKLNKNWF